MNILLVITTPFIIGLIAGFTGTLLGIGGGAIMVPLLILSGINPREAIPASLVAILGTSSGGLYYLIKKRLVDYKLAIILETASITGATLGVILFTRITNQALTATLGATLIASGVLFIIRERTLRVKRGTPRKKSMVRLTVALTVSLLAGLLSALLGIGGGVIKVPVLVLILEMPIHVAVSTSKLMVGITAATGVIGHALHENVNWLLALSLLTGTYTGATISSRLLTRAKPRQLYYLAASYYFIMGTYITIKALLQ